MKTTLQLKTKSGQAPSLTPSAREGLSQQHQSAAANSLQSQSPALKNPNRGAAFGVLRFESLDQAPISQPGDQDEAAADRAADAAVRGKDTEPSSPSQVAQTNGSAASPTDGMPLDVGTRAFMEQRFGHDFSKVRIHTDHQASQTAQLLNARAFTIGDRISFGTGEYNPYSSAGKHLLAHELAHVTQQSRQPQRKMVQRKLTLTGNAANINRALAILNSGLFGYTASADAAGNITVARNGIEGPPTLSQSALYNQLNTILSNAKTVTVAVESGTGTTLVGSWAGRSIDVADMEAMGAGPSGSVATLIHELVEQFQGQVLSAGYGSETTGAHGAGIAAESAVVGATRGAQRAISSSVNADGTINAVVEVPWTYPNGTVVTVTLTITSNNITNVTRR